MSTGRLLGHRVGGSVQSTLWGDTGVSLCRCAERTAGAAAGWEQADDPVNPEPPVLPPWRKWLWAGRAGAQASPFQLYDSEWVHPGRCKRLIKRQRTWRGVICLWGKSAAAGCGRANRGDSSAPWSSRPLDAWWASAPRSGHQHNNTNTRGARESGLVGTTHVLEFWCSRDRWRTPHPESTCCNRGSFWRN